MIRRLDAWWLAVWRLRLVWRSPIAESCCWTRSLRLIAALLHLRLKLLDQLLLLFLLLLLLLLLIRYGSSIGHLSGEGVADDRGGRLCANVNQPNDSRLASHQDVGDALVAIDDFEVAFDLRQFGYRPLHDQPIEAGVSDDRGNGEAVRRRGPSESSSSGPYGSSSEGEPRRRSVSIRFASSARTYFR